MLCLNIEYMNEEMKKVFIVLMMGLTLFGVAACSKPSNGENPIVSIEATVNKPEYNIGDSFAGADLSVVAKKLDGKTTPLSFVAGSESIAALTYSIVDFDSSTAGTRLLGIKVGDLKTYSRYTIKEGAPVVKKYQATYVNYDGSIFSEVKDIAEGSTISKLTSAPTRSGYTFVGWFLSESNHMWDYLNDYVTSDVILEARYLLLNDSNLLVDAYATPSTYVFNTLQELRDSTLVKNGVRVFFAPGVYWTNDYTDPAQATVNTGIEFNFSGLIFQGITSNADDVRICANRCYEDGSSTGNYNVIRVGTDFTALNISVANYAAHDLIFPRDPSQNVPSRIPAINGNPNFNSHGQTIAGGGGNVYMENVRVVAFLNLMAGFSTTNGYFKDCYFQLADDAVFGGTRNVYERCTFDFYGQRPSGGGSSELTIFYACTFNGLNNPNEPQRFCKTTGANTQFVVIDSIFKGAITSVVWENNLRVNKVHYTYNNTFEDGTPVPFTPDDLWATVELVPGSSLDVYKNGDGYEKAAFLGWVPNAGNPTPKVVQAYRLNLTPASTILQSDDSTNEVAITPVITPVGSYTFADLVWEYNENLFSLVASSDDKLHLSAYLNDSGNIISTVVTAVTPNGIKGRVIVDIYPEKVDAPVLTNESISIVDGVAKLTYTLDHDFEDHSDISWYAGATKGAQTTLVGVTSLNNPCKDFTLTLAHVGKYLTAVVTPKYRFSDAATTDIVIEMNDPIDIADIKNSNEVHTNFSNLPWEGSVINAITDKDVFYADVIKPADYTGSLTPSGVPFRYELGNVGGFTGFNGLRMISQGARITYTPSFNVTDMNFSLDYSPNKIEGQGFGGTPQSMEVFFKFDFATYTGYSIRITRTSFSSSATKWELYSYDNGVVTPLIGNYQIPGSTNPDDDIKYYFSSCLPLGNINISVVGNKIVVRGTTQTEETPAQASSYLHEVNYEFTVESMNDFGGFGMQLTTTSGNPLMYHGLDVIYTKKP